MAKKKKNHYLSITQTIYSKKEITEKTFNRFVDAYLDLIDKFGFESGGGFSVSKEDVFDKDWSEDEK